jgi:hypothetical protein
MADFYTVRVVLTDICVDSGPFNISSSSDGINFTLLESDVPSSSLSGSGYFVTNVPDTDSIIKITSNGVCVNEIVTDVINYPTTTTTTTSSCDCSATCCTYSFEFAGEDDEIEFVTCDNNTIYPNFYSTFTACTYEINLPPQIPTNDITFINCGCEGDDPNINYSIEIDSPTIYYGIEIYTFGSGQILFENVANGIPNLNGQTGSTIDIAANYFRVNFSNGPLSSENLFIEITNNSSVIFTQTLLPGDPLLVFERSMSINDNYLIRIYN